jgi:hypothetical protein
MIAWRFRGRPYGAFAVDAGRLYPTMPESAHTVSVCRRRLFAAKRFPMFRTSVCIPSTDVVSAEGIRSNQRAHAKRRLFYA